MTNSEKIHRNEISNTVEKFSPSSSSNMSLPLKGLEYLFLSGIVGVGMIIYVFPDKQDLVIWEAVFVSIWLFLFLLNKQLLNNSHQFDITRKAELYNYRNRSGGGQKNVPYEIKRNQYENLPRIDFFRLILSIQKCYTGREIVEKTF